MKILFYIVAGIGTVFTLLQIWWLYITRTVAFTVTGLMLNSTILLPVLALDIACFMLWRLIYRPKAVPQS